MDIDFIRQLPLFSSLPDDRLVWLDENAERVALPPGGLLMEEGSPADALYIVLDGEFEITKRASDRDVLLSIRGAGEMMGEMSLLEGVARTASVRATRESHLLKISRATFEDMLCGNPTVAMSILRTVASRVRTTEAMLRQNDKMASLGMLSAGLAHELNNPAAAAKRSAGQLRQTISAWLRARGALDALALDPDTNDIVVTRLRDDLARKAGAQSSNDDPITRSDRESDIQTWLEDRGLDEAWEFAPALVSHGWDLDTLEAWCEKFAPAHVPVIVQWLATGYIVDSLLAEVTTSAERISEIVKAVKSYSYLDQAPVQEVDVHETLDNTLVILKHKLKQGVKVLREYAPDLPKIEAYGSELNQVWTNIIDNAIDAMKGQGELTLRTRALTNDVEIEICDNGPGIPPDVQPHIFDPFYTTKGPGSGTGLGLHVSYNIIQKHRGKIEVQSQPGATRFIVTLPIQLKHKS